MKRFFILLTAIAFAVSACKPDDPEKIMLQSLSVSPDTVGIAVGETAQLTVTATPENAEDFSPVWISSDPEIATVDDKGLVSGIAAGSVTITVSSGEIKDECKVTVTNDDEPDPNPDVPVESVTLDPTEASLNVGETYQLIATVQPENATDKTVEWTSSDNEVATVSEDGLVTAVAEGNATITAACSGYEATCDITVTSNGGDEPDPEPTTPPAVGDLYYSDGTWSTELNTGKTVIGVVFWIGDPAKNDPILKADHPEATNGLVMSLVNQNGPWQSNYDAYGALVNQWVQDNLSGYQNIVGGFGYDPEDNLNYMLGYQNTKAIMAFNDAAGNENYPVEAVSGITPFNETVPAPESTSGWYLPSVKEVSLMVTGEYDGNIFDIMDIMIDNKELLNGIISQISGADQIEGIIMSSTEQFEDIPDLIHVIDSEVGYCSLGGNEFKDTSMNYRYILAF